MSAPVPMSPSRSNTDTELVQQNSHSQMSSFERQNTTQSRPQAPSQIVTTEKLIDDAKLLAPAAPAGHLLFVVTDPVAARYIEEYSHVTCDVIARQQRIEGYEIYLVEQWACSRAHPTFLITTYTGNTEDVVLATIISIPADEGKWSPQMRLYFRSLSQYHARKKETPYGTLMITNLSSFPSSLTVIPIPGGNLKKYREIFIVNEDLKRLGCSGRLGIKLEPPNSATKAKFHQLYRTSETIPFNSSVIELVKLCQAALVMFGILEPEYADGLLCDVTEKAVNDWWIEFGADYYTVEPHDGILGPTSVAAILGMLMGARNRLAACNSAVTKDVFDLESTKRSIAHFQKSQHLPRTRRLDRHTLDKLRRATAKAARKEGWAVPRAFKSTVAELGGKGGEMVMDMVGAGQKDGIADVETVDIDQFAELVRGEHAKWLWHGKPRKTAVGGDMFDRLPRDEKFTLPDKHDHTSNPLSRITTIEHNKFTKRETVGDDISKAQTVAAEGSEREKDTKDQPSKRAAIKAKSGSGFHHIKNAVSLRTHAGKLSRDEHIRHGVHAKSDSKLPEETELLENQSGVNDKEISSISDYSLPIMSPIDKVSTLVSAESSSAIFTRVGTETPHGSVSNIAINITSEDNRRSRSLPSATAESDVSTQPPTVESSIAGSIYHGVNLDRALPVQEAHNVPPLLRRTQTGDDLESDQMSRHEEWWPRHLSFSIAEESVLRWTSIINPDDPPLSANGTLIATLAAVMANEHFQSEQLKRLQHNLALLSTKDAVWSRSCLKEITALGASADTDIDTLDNIYYPRLDTYHALRQDAHAIVTSSRAQLNASMRELSNASDKLEYEISTLRGKVEDAEDVLGEFEQQVEFVEMRAGELERVLGNRESWVHWVIRISTGIGKRPE